MRKMDPMALGTRCADCVHSADDDRDLSPKLCLSARCADCVTGEVQEEIKDALCLSARCADCVYIGDRGVIINGDFASAPAARIASTGRRTTWNILTLCLSARCADCVGKHAQKETQYVVHNAVSR